MIPIYFKNPEKSTIEKLYCQLGLTKNGKKTQNELRKKPKAVDDWCKANIRINGNSYSFSEIIKADFSTLTRIKEELDDKKPIMSDELKNYMIDRLYENRFPRKEFVDALDVTVCHYCNHTKGTNQITYSSHNEKFKTDELLTFDFHIKGVDFLNDKQQLGIEIYSSKEVESNIKFLRLRELYQIHTDVVQECIKKAMMFEPDYLNYLANEYKDLFKSEEELYRILFGNFYEENAYGKRPLSKMTSDILRDLIMTYYSRDLRNISGK